MVAIRRVYEPATSSDGFRVLVDRLWPRGVSKEKAQIDLWLKDVAPTDELRTQFHHIPEKFPAFTKSYQQELSTNQAFEQLKQLAREHKMLTLVYAAKDEQHNNAVVLQSLLSK